MAIKKSDLYSSLWASCDELRAGMDASQYKDYVLFHAVHQIHLRRIRDSDDFAPPVTIPKGSASRTSSPSRARATSATRMVCSYDVMIPRDAMGINY